MISSRSLTPGAPYATLVILLLLFCGRTDTDSELKEGLTAFYLFAGNADDGSGHEHHGIAKGTVPAADRFGHAGNALYFNGKSSVIVPANAFRSVNFTFTMWVKPTCYPPNLEQFSLLSIGDDTGRVQGIGLSNNYAGVDNVGFSGASPRLGTRHIFIIITREMPPLNQWYQLAMTNDSEFFAFYVNGKMIQRTPCGGTMPFFGDPTQLMIGIRSNLLSPFKGLIDDVCVYHKTMSAEEIRDIYCRELASPLNYLQ